MKTKSTEIRFRWQSHFLSSPTRHILRANGHATDFFIRGPVYHAVGELRFAIMRGDSRLKECDTMAQAKADCIRLYQNFIAKSPRISAKSA